MAAIKLKSIKIETTPFVDARALMHIYVNSAKKYLECNKKSPKITVFQSFLIFKFIEFKLFEKLTIKMYDKFSCLRIELTINDPKEFKVFKEVNHRDKTTSKRWVPMGKSIANLYLYAEISKAANMRFLNSMHNIVSQQSLEKKSMRYAKRKQ